MSSPLRRSRALACAALLSVVSAAAYAQEPTPSSTPAPARVELTLAGGKGRAAPELTRADVRVLVDGVERPVVSFEKVTQPVSYGLVVDNSGSLRSQMSQVVAAAQFLVEQGGPDDEAFVLRFVASDRIDVLQTLTADRGALNKALDTMYVEGGYTAVLDALYVANKYLTKNARRPDAQGRRLVLVLVTDGEDRGSSHKAKEVLNLLKEGGVQVYCVGLTAELENVPTLTKLNKREKAKDLLAKIAEETGGRVLYAEKGGELEEAVNDVGRGVRTSYVVGYAPPEPGAKGAGKVEVRVVGAPGKEKLKAHLVPPAAKDR